MYFGGTVISGRRSFQTDVLRFFLVGEDDLKSAPYCIAKSQRALEPEHV